MIRRILPFPLLTLALIVLWLLLQQSWAFGHILLGTAIAIFAARAFASLDPEPARVRRIGSIIQLVALVTADIMRSNIAVTRIILQGRHHEQTSGFLMVPLTLRDHNALAILACIITATPGSAWLEYDAVHGVVIIHVLDLVDEEAWIDTVKNRYERLLLEIFE
jgi:multicomponent K+:H+ antiporter subunit E